MLAAFRRGESQAAARAYLDFEANQPFPNDRALNPTPASLQSLIDDLEELRRARPAQLTQPSPEVVESVLLAWLWARGLSPEGQILMGFLSNQRDLQRFRAEGLTQVLVMVPEGGCPACLSLHERAFAVDQAPPLPLLDCRRTPPCACVYLPA